ncbi:alpha/beta fold hydrolase [Rossellomorea vietnamensis]|uniref:alpha/beta fold hydrolase n=1 Tax=Rossellomorea vietnamensis TaxID=218284 RepID=UPI003CF5FE9E
MDFIIKSGISEITSIKIGGIDQSILIQGEDVTKPVILFLHGGPSLPLPGVSSRGSNYTIVTNTKDLVKHFIVVFWDQRGTGKSFHKSIPQESMTVNQFVSDTVEVTDYLRKRFDKEKIFLAGHSWGSLIGLKTVSENAEKYYSYIGLSQIVSWTENDRLGLSWTKKEAKRRNNKRAIKELDSVGEPPFLESFKQWGVLRKWQQRFGTIVHSDEIIKGPSLFSITISMLKSKDYSLRDMYHTFYKGFKLVYSDDFIIDIQKINFGETIKKIDIPVTFIHGKKDIHVFGELLETYYEQLDAVRGKRMIWMDKSGHIFHEEDTARIEQHLIEELKHS